MTGLLVEMLGLPGSGKTALARETRAALLARGVAADVVDHPISAATPLRSRVLRRTAAAARIGILHPRWASRTAAQIVSVRQPSARDTTSVLAQWLAVADLATRARPHAGVHLLEEGPRQTLWTLVLRSPDPIPHELLEVLLPSARSDVVVVLDVPLEVVEARLRRRASKHSRSQGLDPEGLRAELHRGSRLVDALAATSTRVVRLSGGDTTTAAALGRQLAEDLATGPTSHLR